MMKIMNEPNIRKLEFAYIYGKDRSELLHYLKNDLDFNDNTYPYLNHEEVLNMSDDDLRELIIELVLENQCCTELRD